MDALTVREAPSSEPPPSLDDEAAALLVLLRLPGVGDATAARLVAAFGSGSAALSAPTAAFADLAGHPAAAARAGPDLRRRVERGLSWCRSAGVEVRVRGRPGYPASLEALTDPPAVVLLRGRAELLGRPSLAVVGSRRSTAAGRRAAREIAERLAEAGVVTVSGLALGIDAAAHRGALDAGGDTVAVLGTGPDVAHPPSNRGLFRSIAEDGLLVTEFLPGEPAFPHHFPRRNRIMAALSGAVVVVEAARRSGALITVGHALDLGRPVGAVPGSIYGPSTEGSNRLVRDGAAPILEPDDALALLDGGLPLAPAPVTTPSPPVGPGAVVWAALGREPRSVDALAESTGLEAARVLALLSELELSGRAVREAGGRFRRP